MANIQSPNNIQRVANLSHLVIICLRLSERRESGKLFQFLFTIAIIDWEGLSPSVGNFGHRISYYSGNECLATQILFANL